MDGKVFEIIDKEFIENINNAMVMIFDVQYDMFDKTLIIEDGRITGVCISDKIIRG